MVATGEMDYTESVIRARDIELLTVAERFRVLDRLAARYPEAVAAVLEDLVIPKACELERTCFRPPKAPPGCD
jgi:hypothetical protein